jgi:E3 ubiquitin-protein ligase HUWE1
MFIIRHLKFNIVYYTNGTVLLDTPGCNGQQKGAEEDVLPTLSEQLTLDKLWDTLSSCLLELADTPDHHAVLVLQVCG